MVRGVQEPRDQQQGLGKVRVYLRVLNPSGTVDPARTDFFKMDKKKKQVALLGFIYNVPYRRRSDLSCFV